MRLKSKLVNIAFYFHKMCRYIQLHRYKSTIYNTQHPFDKLHHYTEISMNLEIIIKNQYLRLSFFMILTLQCKHFKCNYTWSHNLWHVQVLYFDKSTSLSNEPIIVIGRYVSYLHNSIHCIHLYKYRHRPMYKCRHFGKWPHCSPAELKMNLKYK